MALKALVKDLNEVAEAQRSLYVKTDDGSFMLDVDDSPVKGRIDEFRNNNRKLNGELETLKQQMEKLKGIDPDEYAKAKEALKNLEGLEDAELLKAGKWDEVLKKRTSVMQKDHETKLTAAEKRAAEKERVAADLSGKYKSLRIQTEVARAINEIGTPRPGALEDILARATRVADVDDNDNVVIKGFDEKSEPLTVKTWGKSLFKDAPHLFEPSQGGGATGGRATGSGGHGVKTITRKDAASGRFLKQIAEGTVVVDPNS